MVDVYICNLTNPTVTRTTPYRDAIFRGTPLVQSAETRNDDSNTSLDDAEDFELLLDSGDVAVVRMNGAVVAQVQTPMDLGELGWQLAAIGYVTEEMIAFDGGVIEMLLRPLGEVSDAIPEDEQRIMKDIHEFVQERERVYA